MAQPRPRIWANVARTPVGIVALSLIGLVVLTAILAPIVLGGAATHIDTDAINQGPSGAHIFGTDALGRDLFARVLVATRLSLVLGLLATVLGVAIGMVLGAARVLLGVWVGRLADVVINVTNAFPSLLMILFFTAVFGVTTSGALFALALSTAPTFARLTRTLTASVEEQDFVAAARMCEIGRGRMLVRHILPNVAEPLILNATMAAGGALLAFGGLSFLGIGIQAPSYDYGKLLNDGLSAFYVNPMAVLGPSIAIILAGLGFSLLGEAASHAVSRRAANAVTATTAPARADGTAAQGGSDRLLSVQDLAVSFRSGGAEVIPVRGISLDIDHGMTVGIVGESGSGKSLTALAVAQLIESPGQVMAGRLEFAGQDLRRLSERDKRTLLGTSLAVVFQNPMSSFNPIRRLGRQLSDGARFHEGLGAARALRRAQHRLGQVGIASPQTRVHCYPHQFSGGMQQRAMIAMGLMGSPKLIMADEPTTALDATTQHRVLALLKGICARDGAALLLISHDITVVRRVCDRVLVMYAGRVVEDLAAADLHDGAAHPYTRALLAAVPDLDADRDTPLAVIPGRAPGPTEIGQGCPFAARCPLADDRCRTEEPALVPLNDGHRAACWHPGELLLAGAVAEQEVPS
jgi:oligopeptide/dipeptide ABC transporter ATP-binding protein